MQPEETNEIVGEGETWTPDFLKPKNVELAETIARELGIGPSFSGTFAEIFAGGYTVAREVAGIAPQSHCVRFGLSSQEIPTDFARRLSVLPGVEVSTREISEGDLPWDDSTGRQRVVMLPECITSGNYKVVNHGFIGQSSWSTPSRIEEFSGDSRPRHIYICPTSWTPVVGNSTERMKQRNEYNRISEVLGFPVPLRMREWLQAGIAVQLLGPGERVAVLVKERALSLSLGMQDRQSFVEAGYVEKVVQLDHPFYPEHSEEADATRGEDSYRGAEFLVLLSTGNTSVTFSRGANGEDGRTVHEEKNFPIEQIEGSDWSLLPSDYLERELSPKLHTVFLKDIADIRRGGLSRKRLAELTDERIYAKPLTDYELPVNEGPEYLSLLTVKKFGFLYVTSTDFEDGEIVRFGQPHGSSGGMSLRASRNCQMRVCTYRRGYEAGDEKDSFVKAPCLLVSRVPRAVDGSQRFAICLVEAPEEVNIAAAENVVAMSLGRREYDPLFLMAFLRSGQGQDLLRRAATGTHLSQLSMTNLARTRVPMCDFGLQNEISSRYMRSWHEKGTLEKARLSIKREEDGLFGQEVAVYEGEDEHAAPAADEESMRLSHWTLLYPDPRNPFRYAVEQTLDEYGKATEETERLVLENYARMVWREDHLLFGLLGIDRHGCLKLIRDALEDKGGGATCLPDDAGSNGSSDGTEGLSESDIDKVMDEAYENFLTGRSTRASISAMRNAALEAISTAAIRIIKKNN